MRIARNLAAVVALGVIAFAVGDWASHPNAMGMLGILLLGAVFAVLLAYLFRPADRAPKAPKEPKEPRAPKARRSRTAPTAAGGWDASEASVARESRRSGRGANRVVDLNSADEDELMTLPGVGRVAARRIVEARETGGPFSTVSDLGRVDGFSPAKVRAIGSSARV